MDCSQLSRELGGFAVERDRGTASGPAAHLDVPPGDPVIPSGPNGFHGGFFGGEAGGVTFHSIGLRFAVADLGVGKDPVQKAIAEACDGRFDARGLRYVDASADDHKNSLVGRTLCVASSRRVLPYPSHSPIVR